jgi:hypothetical protein
MEGQMSDDNVHIDTNKLDQGSAQFDEVAARIRSVATALGALPNPKQGAGTGADSLSSAFLSSWTNLHGDDLMRLVSTTNHPGGGTTSRDLTEITDELAKTVRYASEVLKRADEDAAETAAQALRAVLAKESGEYTPVDDSAG